MYIRIIIEIIARGDCRLLTVFSIVSYTISVTTASLRVLFEEYGELVPDIKWTFQRYKPTLEAHKEWAKSRTYGPEYIGCDEFRPSVSSQGIRSWNLLVSQAYDEITTREEIKALLPIYENLADRLMSAHQWFRSKKQC
ncbi:unnamed protein product [Trichobilharzia szidati]|nr:unnamed protein product [Trichobilharzia szidati]